MHFSKSLLAASIACAALTQASAETFVSEDTPLPMQEVAEFDYESIDPIELEGAYYDDNGNVNLSNAGVGEGELAGYSEANAGRLVRFAAASYCSRVSVQKISNWNCKVCSQVGKLSDVHPFNNPNRNTNGYVGYESGANRIVVAFAGTDPTSWKNIWTDISTVQTNYGGCSGCKVHYGFYTAYVEIRPTIVNLIQKLRGKYPSASITVTGHSLGGALAAHAIADFQSSVFGFATGEDGESVLLGSDNPSYQLSLEELKHAHDADLEVETPTELEAQSKFLGIIGEASAAFGDEAILTAKFPMNFPMYTFGQPRLGNPAFAKWYMDKMGRNVYRVTHGRDPVPHLPPMAMGFQHPTTELFYSEDQSRYSDCSAAEDTHCSNQFVLKIGFDHHKNYVRFPISDYIGNC